MAVEKGKFIVIEGNDGSGKGTQLALLKNYLEKKNVPVATFDFPQYNSFHGETIARFLAGEFGPIENISPYLLSLPYALDRLGAAPYIKAALDAGKIALANRYVGSNLAHQSGRLPKEQQAAFINWDVEMEYYVNGLPREDIVVFLFVPSKHAQKLLKTRSTRERDMVEKNKAYLTASEEAYLHLVERFDHWIKIDCVNEKGELLSKDEIHKKIVLELSSRHLI